MSLMSHILGPNFETRPEIVRTIKYPRSHDSWVVNNGFVSFIDEGVSTDITKKKFNNPKTN